MHGGLVATLADEIAAWAITALLCVPGFTAQMTRKLHKPVGASCSRWLAMA